MIFAWERKPSFRICTVSSLNEHFIVICASVQVKQITLHNPVANLCAV
tara:strand:+ start:9977 stop:10120 length:144 start_codon:yes stop_codon:yes gene_type:complete